VERSSELLLRAVYRAHDPADVTDVGLSSLIDLPAMVKFSQLQACSKSIGSALGSITVVSGTLTTLPVAPPVLSLGPRQS